MPLQTTNTPPIVQAAEQRNEPFHDAIRRELTGCEDLRHASFSPSRGDRYTVRPSRYDSGPEIHVKTLRYIESEYSDDILDTDEVAPVTPRQEQLSSGEWLDAVEEIAQQLPPEFVVRPFFRVRAGDRVTIAPLGLYIKQIADHNRHPDETTSFISSASQLDRENVERCTRIERSPSRREFAIAEYPRVR